MLPAFNLGHSGATKEQLYARLPVAEGGGLLHTGHPLLYLYGVLRWAISETLAAAFNLGSYEHASETAAADDGSGVPCSSVRNGVYWSERPFAPKPDVHTGFRTRGVSDLSRTMAVTLEFET